MEEKALLNWIDERISGNNAAIQSLSMIAQQHALSDTAQQVWNRTVKDNGVLKDLKRVVINWYQKQKVL